MRPKALVELAQPHAVQDGLHPTAISGLSLYRATRSDLPKQVEAKMVTLAVVLRGKKRVDFETFSITYAPGDFLFVTGERRYLSTIVEASPEAPYLSLSLPFTPSEIAEVLLALTDAGLDVSEPADDPPAVSARLDPELEAPLIRIVRSLSDPVSRAVLAPLARRELLVHLLRHPAGAPLVRAASADDGRIRRVVAFIDDNAHQALTVERLARRARMSPSHFAHRFRQVVRMSPIQYVKLRRLERARLLMLSDGCGAAEAASKVGYGSPSHFTRDFKAFFGAPPSAYVQRFRLAS